jgi:hypothetical protein
MEQHHEVPDLRWQHVRCTRCHRDYMCTPWDDFHDPREEFGWHAGGVCMDCLVELFKIFEARHGKLPLRNPTETRLRERKLIGRLRHHRRK